MPLQCYVADGSNMLACLLADISASVGGEQWLGLLVGGVILVGFYIVSGGRLEVPTVVLILLGGAIVPMLPGHLAQLQTTIIILGLVSGFLAIGRRYLMPGYQ